MKPKNIIVAASYKDIIPLKSADPDTIQDWVLSMQIKASGEELIHCRDSLWRVAKNDQPSTTVEDIEPFCSIMPPELSSLKDVEEEKPKRRQPKKEPKEDSYEEEEENSVDEEPVEISEDMDY